MQFGRLLVCSILCLSLSFPAAAQQASTQPSQLLQQALTALGVSSPITDITLTGSVQRTAGSDDETGAVTLKALAAGATRMDLTLSSGSSSEIVNISSGTPTGIWSGPDAVSHPLAYHNLLLVDPTWFFPAFPISRGLATSVTAIYLGHEMHNGQAVEHLSVIKNTSAATRNATLLQHLSQIDIYLSSTTLLPAALDFSIHPDDDARLDIPIEILFSDYRPVNAVQVPFHVQKFINNGLSLDLQFQSATLNSGLIAADFSVGAAQ